MRIKISDADVRRMYCDEKMTCERIASLIGCTGAGIRHRLIVLGIPRRDAWKVPKGFQMHKHRKTKGTVVNSSGYRQEFLPEHPNATKQGYVLQHRLVISRKIGRDLLSKEVVHHVDGNKLNNDPENLILLSGQREHKAVHHRGFWTEKRIAAVRRWSVDLTDTQIGVLIGRSSDSVASLRKKCLIEVCHRNSPGPLTKSRLLEAIELLSTDDRNA